MSLYDSEGSTPISNIKLDYACISTPLTETTMTVN